MSLHARCADLFSRTASPTPPSLPSNALAITEPGPHASMEATPGTRARIVATLSRGSSSIKSRIEKGRGEKPVSLRSLLNKVTKTDLEKSRQALKNPENFMRLKKGRTSMRVAAPCEGLITASDNDDPKSAKGAGKALFITNPPFPVTMILHVNTARKGPKNTQEGDADYRTSMRRLLDEKTADGAYKISDKQLAAAVTMHLKGFEIEFNLRFPTINTKKDGIPATYDSYVELVESKEGGFTNMVLPDYDGIGAFSILYPTPKNNTEPARTPVMMLYAALTSQAV